MPLESKKMSSIEVKNPSTWRDRVFLTFDVDWAHDEIIDDVLELLSGHQCETTWFITHESEYLNRLRESKFIEIGIHPNFNDVLNGGDLRQSRDIIKKLKEIVPEAMCLRSHSLTQSEKLLDQFLEQGLTHISNTYIPHYSQIDAKPFELWSGLTIVPHQYQDNVELRNIPRAEISNSSQNKFRVYNFHPIHVFLNSERLDRYEMTREIHHRPSELLRYRFGGSGVRTRLIRLLQGDI